MHSLIEPSRSPIQFVAISIPNLWMKKTKNWSTVRLNKSPEIAIKFYWKHVSAFNYKTQQGCQLFLSATLSQITQVSPSWQHTEITLSDSPKEVYPHCQSAAASSDSHHTQSLCSVTPLGGNTTCGVSSKKEFSSRRNFFACSRILHCAIQATVGPNIYFAAPGLFGLPTVIWYSLPVGHFYSCFI